VDDTTITVGDPNAKVAVVMLHGREMCGADLSPFATSLAKDAYWMFPDAPLPAARARTWWPIDSEQRLRALHAGPMELSAMDPPGRADARAFLDAIVQPLAQPFVLAGFSQGGMLAMDYVLHGGKRPAALALLSSTRIAIADWTDHGDALRDLPVLVAHGHDDRELSFRAGELLRDFAGDHGARVTWLPFDGGHQLPFVVWRALKKLAAGSIR
jgi:phospholipase/carboxylesterase